MAAFVFMEVLNSCMPKKLTQFWSKLPIQEGALYVHPDDHEWFHKNRWDIQSQSVSSFDNFVRSNRFGADDKQLHLSLLPVPFAGNLEDAKIFILLMNPGLSPSDYYAEENPNFRAACIRNLRQSNGNDEFPFFSLNPEFAWSGGFIWWEARLRPILVRLMETSQFSTYYEALAFLAKKIAVIELAPYHSVGGSALNGSGKPWKNLPSVNQARSFVQRLCASRERPLILALRSHEHWELDTHPAACACGNWPVLRRPTLNPDLVGQNGDTGRAILQKLGISR